MSNHRLENEFLITAPELTTLILTPYFNEELSTYRQSALYQQYQTDLNPASVGLQVPPSVCCRMMLVDKITIKK